MVRKQQESKIQFYDYDDTYVPPSRTITPSSVSRHLSRESPEAEASHRKLETLKSRIEFYDYVDEGDAPLVVDRRSSGRRDSQLGSRESESRSVAVNKETYAPEEDRTDGRTTINHSAQVVAQKSTNTTSDKISRSLAPREPIGEMPRTPLQKKDLRSTESKRQIKLSSSVIDLSTLDLLDDPELEELKKLRGPNKNDIERKLATFHTEIREATRNDSNHRSSRSHVDRQTTPPRSTVIRTVLVNDQSQQPERTINGMRQKTSNNRNPDPVQRPVPSRQTSVEEDVPNEARRMAHRHLQSSFSFGDAPPKQPPPGVGGARRPASIRDTAVCRVGVGLPDL